MSISYQIPHTSRYIPTTNTFIATFNNPTLGKYDFTGGAVQNQTVIQLFRDTIYLIERISVGGDLSEQVYRESIFSTVPILTLRRKQGNQIVYKNPMPIPNFIDDQDITAWIISDKQDDELLLSLDGVLTQVAETVGRDTLKLFISYSIYAIESSDFARAFRGDLSRSVGQEVIGSI